LQLNQKPESDFAIMMCFKLQHRLPPAWELVPPTILQKTWKELSNENASAYHTTKIL